MENNVLLKLKNIQLQLTEVISQLTSNELNMDLLAYSSSEEFSDNVSILSDENGTGLVFDTSVPEYYANYVRQQVTDEGNDDYMTDFYTETVLSEEWCKKTNEQKAYALDMAMDDYWANTNRCKDCGELFVKNDAIACYRCLDTRATWRRYCHT